MTTSDDVIVFDEEYTYAAREIEDYCAALVQMIERYSKCINTILDKAIQDNAISFKLQSLVNEVESIKPEITAIGTEVAAACRDYINEIDSADRFLY